MKAQILPFFKFFEEGCEVWLLPLHLNLRQSKMPNDVIEFCFLVSFNYSIPAKRHCAQLLDLTEFYHAEVIF